MSKNNSYKVYLFVFIKKIFYIGSLLLSSQELMKQGIQNGMKHVSVNVDQMQVFVIVNNAGIMINVNVNVKN